MGMNVVAKIRQATRRKYTAEEKIRIVLEGLRGEIPISELCRRDGRPNFKEAHYKVWRAEEIVIDSTPRAHAYSALIASKSGPVVSKFAVPLIRKPVPGPSLPATSRLPSVITTRGSLDMLASVLCMYPAGISILSPAENRT